MGYYEDYLEDKKKRDQALRSKEQGGGDDSFYKAYLEDKKRLGFEVPKPSQVAKQEVMPTKVEEKKPSLFESIKTKATDIFSSLTGKKKVEEQLAKVQQPLEAKVDTTQIQQPIKLQNNIFDDLISREKSESAQLVPEVKQQVDNTLMSSLSKLKTVNEKSKAVLVEISKRTSGTGIEATIRSASPEVTFKQAYETLRLSQQKKDDTLPEQFLTGLKDTLPQTALGIALGFVPVVGPGLSTSYWAAISAGSEIEEKGYATPTNVGIDVVGDRVLGGMMEKLFKTPAKSLLKIVKKAFVVEGGTEVAQDLAKFANDYRLAESEEERGAVIDKAKNYITSGQILVTAGVGGVSGGGIAAVTTGIERVVHMTPEATKETIQISNLSGTEAGDALTEMAIKAEKENKSVVVDTTGTKGDVIVNTPQGNPIGISLGEEVVKPEVPMLTEEEEKEVKGIKKEPVVTEEKQMTSPEALKQTKKEEVVPKQVKSLNTEEVLGKARELGKTAFELGYETPGQDNRLDELSGPKVSTDKTLEIMAEWSRAKKSAELESKYGGPVPKGIDENELLNKYQKVFARMFEVEGNLAGGGLVSDRQEHAMKVAVAKEFDLTKDQQDFILDEISYMPPSAIESVDSFKNFIVDNNNQQFHQILDHMKYLEPVDTTKEPTKEKPKEPEKKKPEIKVETFDVIPTREGGFATTKPKVTFPEVKIEPSDIKLAGEIKQKEKIARATELGREAFKSGIKRVPALDKSLNDLQKDLQVGEGVPIMEAWLKAWDKANLEEPLPESGIIKTDETTAIQPTGVSDTGEVRQPADRERGPEIDERTLHDQTAVPSELRDGSKPDRARIGRIGRAEINTKAVNILEGHSYSTDVKEYTQEELDTLSQYSGAGGKEVAGATGKGLLSEYYTPKEVTDKVWEIANSLVPNAVKALEPSIGIGSLLKGRPSGIEFKAYEYQRVSGTIAKLLNPDIDVSIGNGEEFGNSGNFETHKSEPEYDLVVGNPPFGERASFLKGKGEEPKINRWEEYFIKKGLDSLREGGKLIYVVNSSFLNKENTFAKEEIAKIGRLSQAFRLPEGIFADTTIGTDIVVFEKTPALSEKGGSNDRLEIQKRIVDMTSGNYFDKNQDNVAGVLDTRKNRFGVWESYVKGTIEDVKNLSTLVEQKETKETDVTISDKPVNDKFFTHNLREGVHVFDEVKGTPVKITHIEDAFVHRQGTKAEGGNKENWIVTEAKTGLLIGQGVNKEAAIKNANMHTEQAGAEKVKTLVEEAVSKQGATPRYTGKAPTGIKLPNEPSYSIKVLKRATSTSAKEKFPAIITPDKKKVEVVPVQTISGGVGSVDPIESKILKETKVDGSVDYIAEAKKVLNYHQGKYYHDVNYFSGDIYQKIEDLKEDKETIVSKLGQAQYDKQLKGLEAVKPKPVELKDITFDPLDRYVTEIRVDEESGVKLIDQFVNFLNKTDSALSYGVGKWDVRNYVMGFRASPGTKNVMGAIKADSSRLFNYFVRNVLSNEVQEQIVAKFNREKNSYVNPDYSKIPTEIKQMAKYFRGKEFRLSKTQANGVSFLTNKGVGLVAYGVGVGKTHTILTATMVAKQRGWTKRPAFIVPKSTLSQTWIATIKSMFPNDTIVNLGGLTKPDVTRLEKERGKDRKKWIKDGEVAVLTHEGLLRLALTPEEMSSAVGDLKDALMSESETERQAAKQAEKVTEIVGKAQYKAGDINISDLGIDHISVDEVHNFRKVFQGAKPEAVLPDGTVDKSKTRRFANVIGGTPSKQAQQLFLISQYILKKNNNRGVYLASATPFENHATEVYNILSFVARDRLKKIGIYNINDFFALFSNFETEMEKSVKGEWVNKEKMKSFKNLPQLQKILREFVDYQVDPTLVRPERKVLTPTLQMSSLQEENLRKIQEMLKPSDNKKPEDGAVLKASTYSVANSISPYFIKEYHPEIVSPEELVDNSPKLKYSMELIKWLKNNEATKNYGTFMYMGSNGVEYHHHLTDYAVKHLGFKANEVAVINGATSNDEREAIKNEFNSGIIKLLIGGDPTKEGIDLQNNGYVTINNALGWNPTEPAQVEGRVWRQGNKRSIAPLIYPLVENSGDITVYNKFEEKGSRINDLFSYQGQIFDVGELDPREKKLALMTNPEDKAAIEIEMDKAGLQNQLMMYATDIGNYKRIQDRIASLNESIKFNQERIVTGKTQWGSPIDPEGVSNYRKELNKQKKELASIQEKLDKAGITDIDAEIKRIEGLKEETNIDIGKITKTYEERLAKFQREYDEMVANRKSTESHVQDFVESTKDLKELGQEELDAKKEKLMKEYELKQIQDNDVSRYKAPSGNADVGGYADLEASGVTVQNVRAIQFPEMVSLVRELTGDVPKLKSFKRALGRMYEKGEGIIKLNPNIFDNPIVAAKVLAHEIGHLADFIPDGFTTRGNLIGHIASLSKFMQGKYGDLVNKDIKTELKNLTQLWKPFDETVNANYTKYRYSSKELYADAVSVLLNDPGLLQKVAPQFYDGFFTYLSEKPKYEQAYFDTLELLDKGEEALNNKRLEEIYEGFKEAREKRKQIEETEKPVKPFFERLMRNHITKFDPIYRKLDKVDIGVVESSKQKVREALEEMQMRRNDQAIFLDKITTEITDALEKIGLNEDDLGVVLKLERESLGDRINLANPGGLIGNIPETVLTHYYKQKNFTDEQIKVFEQIKTRFHQLIFAETERAVKNGNFNKQVFEEKIAPNKDTYATFSVVDYIHKNYIDAGIKKQTGTLKRIENPFTSSVLKTVALIDWNNVQEAKQVVMGELQQYFPDDAKEAKAVRTNKGTVIRFSKEDGREVLEMMRDGRKIGFNVDPYIKEMFESGYFTADEVHQIVGISRWFNKAFKPLVTTYNLSWGFYSNIIRDAKRTYISLGAALNKFAPDKKNVGIGEMLVSYLKSIPEGVKFAAGQKSELINEMLKNKALTTSWSQYDPNANNDSSIAFLLRQHKLIGKQEDLSATKKLVNNTVGKVLEGIKYAGGVFEATSKISGYQIAKKRISDGKRLGFIVRNYVGTPNYTEGGNWKQIDNDVFVFSNIMIQATRASVELATDPKTASGYWMRTFMIGVLPKLLMVMGLAGWWGEWVKENFQKQTEYDKTNYITVPMGFDENGKAVYVRVPQDESERFISAIVWKTLSGLVQKKAIKPEQVLSIGAGYIPSVTPLWTAVGDWVGYLQGRNPYDNYRGRLAIDETSWKAGGLIRLGKMVQYSANTLGLSNFKTYDSSNKSTTEVLLDRIPVLNRMFQTSDYGIQEMFSSSTEQESARKTLKKREIVSKYVDLSRNITDPVELSAIRTNMVKEYFGGALPTDKDSISEGKALAKKFTIQRERGESPYMDKLIYSNTNAEKIDYLQQFQKVMSTGDFKQLVNNALKYKIVSGDVVKELKQLDLQSGYGKEEPQGENKLLNFKLVKEAFAAENITDLEKLKNKLIWSKDERGAIERALGRVQELIPGIQGSELPREAIVREKLSDDKRREYYDTMIAIRDKDPDWYYQNIGNKVEKRILGHDLGSEKEVRPYLEAQKKVVSTEEVQPPAEKKEAPTPTSTKTREKELPDGTKVTIFETPHDDVIDKEFGDKADEARRVLKWDNGKGENPGYVTGEGWIDQKTGDHGDYNYKTEKKIVDGKTRYFYILDKDGNKIKRWVDKTNGKDTTEDNPNAVVNEDRGLFRINSGSFYDLMRRKPKKLEELGINSYDDMYDVKKNIAIAKIIFDEGGWKRWYGAAPELIK